MSELIPLIVLTGSADSLWQRGRAHNIPECCIAEFVADVEYDRFPAELRGSLANAWGAYVPCTRCRAEANTQVGVNVEQEARAIDGPTRL